MLKRGETTCTLSGWRGQVDQQLQNMSGFLVLQIRCVVWLMTHYKGCLYPRKRNMLFHGVWLPYMYLAV